MPRRQRAAEDDAGKRVTTDAHLRRELAICERFQISHSHYLGGPAVWTPEDRAKVEAFDDWKADLCETCSTHDDWWDPERGGDRFAFVANSRRCPGCEIIEQYREQIPSHAKGIHVFLEPNTELTGEQDGDDHG